MVLVELGVVIHAEVLIAYGRATTPSQDKKEIMKPTWLVELIKARLTRRVAGAGSGRPPWGAVEGRGVR